MHSTDKSHGKTHTFRTLTGAQNGNPPMDKGVGISSRTIYAFTHGPSHPLLGIFRNKEMSFAQGDYCCVALLNIEHHDFQHRHNKPDSSINAETSSEIIYKDM